MNEEIHWLLTGFIGVGGTLIAWLLNRTIGEQDAKIDDAADGVAANRTDITALKVDVARALSGNDALGEQLRVLRHDVREVKQGVDGITHILMQGKK